MSSPRPALELVLVRHGESDWNLSGRAQGQSDYARLTEYGRTQATRAAGLLVSSRFDTVISSDLTRATETASIITAALGLDFTTTPALRERCEGAYEGGALSALTPDLLGIDGGVVTDDVVRPGGGESLNDVYVRVATFVEGLKHKYKGARVLLVSHGGPIRAIRAYGEGRRMHGLVWDRVDNGSIWVVTLGESEPSEEVS